MAELVRVAALSGYIEAMAGLGCDPAPLLREQGLSAGLLANPEQLIPAAAAVRLLEHSARQAGCMTLGLRMAEGRAMGNLGVTSLLIAHQPTLRQAVSTLREYRARINSTLVIHLEEAGGEAMLREEFSLGRPEPARQSADLALGVLVRLCGEVLGAGWAPLLTCFVHEEPSATDLELFRRLFRAPLQFNSEYNAIVMPSADLDRANPRADARLAHHARQLLDAVLPPAGSRTAQDLDQLIRLHLPAGRATLAICAQAMGLPVRTLQRRLDAEGTSFSGLLDKARMQLANQCLANPRMRITDVAEILGYGSIGAFSRWYAQAFGQSPRDARKALIGEG